MSSTASPVGPPQCMLTGDPSGADAARQRFVQKSRFTSFVSLPNLRLAASKRKTGKGLGNDQAVNVESPEEPIPDSQEQASPICNLIILDESAISQVSNDRDLYRWAVLYENQRGMRIFSVSYYSRLSLLPTDPSPFTIPSASSKRAKQANVSLTEYPLPDGTWHWVSKCWMIDMRSDSGEVQHDGFEYNWIFRKDKWRAEVGTLSAGGWVRRRRWVRLMMRPATTRRDRWDHSQPRRDSWLDSPMVEAENGRSVGPSLPPSVTGADNPEDDAFGSDVDEIWKGEDAEQDWVSCCAIMKRVGRDGRKLELWKSWLGTYVEIGPEEKGKKRQKQWTEDDAPLPSEVGSFNKLTIEYPSPSLQHIRDVLRTHGDSLLRSFIFPDSRAQFLDLLGRAGLLADLNVKLGIGWTANEVDFWSYTNG